MSITHKTKGTQLTQAEYEASDSHEGTHGSEHTDGTDDIQNATDAQKGLLTLADHQLLPTSDEKDALAGEGTPSSSNKYACKDYVDARQIDTVLTFYVDATLATGTKQGLPATLHPSVALTIDKVWIHVETAPTGAAIIVDVNKNGTTIFTTQSNRPQIAISGTTDESGVPDVTALAQNDEVTIDIDQIGSTVAGSDITVYVRCKQTIA